MTLLAPPLALAPQIACRLKRVPSICWFLLAATPSLIWFSRRMNDGSDEPLGLISLVLVLVLAWRDRKSLCASTLSRFAGASLALTATLTQPYLPPMIRAAIMLAGGSLFYGIHRKFGLFSLLLLSLPVVASLDFWAGYPMRALTAEGVARILRLFGVVISRDGSSLAISGITLNVDPACSGVRLLWHSLVASSALAAFHRLSFRKTLLLQSFALVGTIPVNMTRALLLAIATAQGHEESSFLHECVGLTVAAILLGLLAWYASRHSSTSPAASDPSTDYKLTHMFLILAAFCGPLLGINPTPRSAPSLPTTPWSDFSFQGVTLPLQPLELTPIEQNFSTNFPGTIGSYQWSGRQVILRRVTQATRKLHPSRDCLRAAGYETTPTRVEIHSDGSRWSVFTATRYEWKFRVHERIRSEANQQSWTDVSAWYWSALLNPLNGPWRAETVIESE